MDKTKTLNFLSVLSYPTIVAIPLIIAFAWPSIVNIVFGIIFVSILPMGFAFYYIKKHGIDFEVSDHTMRTKPFVCALVSYIIGVFAFYFLQAGLMLALSAAYFVVALVIAIISTRWKISVHCAGIAGAVTDVVYVFGLLWLPLFVLVAGVAWVRLELKAHNIRQVVAGSLVSIVLSFLVFWILYPV